MSVIFYVLDERFEIHVENPGYGQILLYAPAYTRELPPLVVDEPWSRRLHGAEIGEFLTRLTARALGTEPGTPPLLSRRPVSAVPHWSVHLPPFMKPDIAKAVLPSFTQAVVLAASGTDRFERTFTDLDEPPREPFCVRCDLGTIFTPGAMTNGWCEQYGHTPYGHADGTSWEAATAHYNRRRAWWDQDHQHPQGQ